MKRLKNDTAGVKVLGEAQRIVPTEPTDAMVDAACNDLGLCAADKADEEIRQEYRVAYRAMVFAAAGVAEAGHEVNRFPLPDDSGGTLKEQP